jgi:hypothetical protein
LLFGYAADAFGLRTAFLVALPALLANALVLVYATRSYPSDVATVAASVDPDTPMPVRDDRGADVSAPARRSSGR